MLQRRLFQTEEPTIEKNLFCHLVAARASGTTKMSLEAKNGEYND